MPAARPVSLPVRRCFTRCRVVLLLIVATGYFEHSPQDDRSECRLDALNLILFVMVDRGPGADRELTISAGYRHRLMVLAFLP